MRIAHIAATFLLLTSGCHYYRVDPEPRPGPAYVRVRFDPPRAFDLPLATRDTVRLRDVVYLSGQLLSVRSDTLTLQVLRAYTRDDRVRRLTAGASIVGVPPSAGRVLEVRRLDRPLTVVTILGAPVVALLALGLVLAPTD
jgi:hypothetical protein